MKVQQAKSRIKANYPFIVQHKNTENWNTMQAYTNKSDALEMAQFIANSYPRMPVRVLHCTGGAINN